MDNAHVWKSLGVGSLNAFVPSGLVFFFSFLLTMIGYYQTKISRENLFKKKRKNVMFNRVLRIGYGIIH